jgi:hypothetical protein
LAELGRHRTGLLVYIAALAGRAWCGSVPFVCRLLADDQAGCTRPVTPVQAVATPHRLRELAERTNPGTTAAALAADKGEFIP